jgi:lipopolysaccharide export system permease protein
MRCITRYILAEFLKVFLVSLIGLTAVLMLAVVGQEMMRQGLSLVNVLRLIPFALPTALVFAIPGTTLFAVCFVYGRMAANNEVMAVKSMGVSPMVILWPIFILSFLFSLLVVGLNDIAVSWGREGVKRVVVESVEQIAYSMLRTRSTYTRDQFSISVTKVVGKRLIGPTITFHEDDETVVIVAAEAVLKFNPKKNALIIILTDLEVVAGNRLRLYWPDDHVIEIDLDQVESKALGTKRPADIALRRIPFEVEDQLHKIEELRQAYAAEAAYEMLTGDFESLADEEWSSRHAIVDHARNRLCRLYTEPWRRWATGFSCLAFVLVGAPLAIQLRNSDVWTSFAICFMPILVVYYPLLAVSVDQAKSGDLPAWCVWIGNFVMAIVGWWMLKRVQRY